MVVGAVFAAGSVMAQTTIPSKMNFSGTVTYQTVNTTNNAKSVITAHAKSVAFNTKTLIHNLNNSSAFTTALATLAPNPGSIPANSWFTLDQATGTIVVTNKSGYRVNLTTLLDQQAVPVPFASSTLSSATPGVFTGTAKDNSTQTPYAKKVSSISSFSFQDGLFTSITVSGLTTETFNGKAAVGASNAENRSFTFVGYGGGTVAYGSPVFGATAVVKGVASGNGKGQQP